MRMLVVAEPTSAPVLHQRSARGRAPATQGPGLPGVGLAAAAAGAIALLLGGLGWIVLLVS